MGSLLALQLRKKEKACIRQFDFWINKVQIDKEPVFRGSLLRFSSQRLYTRIL